MEDFACWATRCSAKTAESRERSGKQSRTEGREAGGWMRENSNESKE